jgi:hypothetical protein
LEDVIERLCGTINSLTPAAVENITGGEWILSMF